ncbi:MAG: DUF4920 domain-containing protein [Bacteroidetes bacterium]|nr:DUF4920 domain-containing protein [Bacteroidota bacterium]
MRKTVLLLITFIALSISCSNDPRSKLSQTGNFGETIENTNDSKDAIAAYSTIEQTDTNETGIFSGTIANYCKGEGCWMTLENGSKQPILVDIEDKAFVLPRKIEGKKAYVKGTMVKDSTEIKILAKGILIQ